MKTLLIIRHAKSSCDITTLNDFDRALNERGKKDAPVMAQRLVDKHINIEAFVTSPAKRAKKTAEFFCTVIIKKKKILFYSLHYIMPRPKIFIL